MRAVFRIAAFTNLLPLAIVLLWAPVGLLELVSDADKAIVVAPNDVLRYVARYLGAAYLVLFVTNAVAAGRPSVWKPVLVLDLLLFGVSALVPLVFYLEGGRISWVWWVGVGVDATLFLVIGVAAIRTFWTK